MEYKIMGLIRNSKQVKQSIDFQEIQNGNIHPSDIDAVLEFNNEAIIFIEVKRIGNDIPLGQRLLLERLTDSWHTEKAITIKVNHSFFNEETDIPLNECKVEKYYTKGTWIESKTKNLKDFLNSLGKEWNISKLTLK